ncbi:hypothetical protein [Streptomyces atratus]|uniref:hypothetical protein n=1 Tax=Streptomyces atratus TaxID=1893 RepID=UPI003663774D
MSSRRRPTASLRRSPALASSSTMNRSRALRQARSRAKTSSSVARPTGSSGSAARCLALAK